MIENAIEIVQAGGSLSMEQMAFTMGHIMDGACTEQEIAQLLTALHDKGETVTEVAGAAAAMRQRMTPIRSTHTDLIDTCGTGGDGSRTFNISTAAALVAAAAGAHVAKHGNRGMTSRSGSADVLATLGVNIEANVPLVETCLNELGICFCFAPILHTAMKHVAAVRKKLGTPTIFNILGPLVNPASAPFQLLGVGRPEIQPLLAEALHLLGIRRALVVHGTDGLDEVTLSGATDVIEVIGPWKKGTGSELPDANAAKNADDKVPVPFSQGATSAGQTRRFQWTPADFGFEQAPRDTMLVSGPAESAELIRKILAGHRGPARDIVVINAAAAIWTAGRWPTLPECAEQAKQAIDSGAAQSLLVKLARRTLPG